jgi:hypothetical protein
MSPKRKLTLIFDSEDFESPKDLVLHIAYAIKEFNSAEMQSELQGRPPFSKDLVIQINQKV